LSGLISNRLNFQLEKGPRSTAKIRIAGALTGGLLWGIGAQLGRGCTSGAALSGMAVMSTGGIITMFAILPEHIYLRSFLENYGFKESLIWDH
jgi:uncharacterized protein